MRIPKPKALVALCGVSLAVSLFLWPVHVFTLESPKGGCAFPVPLGQLFSTRFIHSVQLSPVEDDYIVSSRGLWTVEERTRGFNAGLPTEAPRNGVFLTHADCFVVRAARLVDPIFYRVGTKALGRNVLFWPPRPPVRAYLLAPGRRIRIGTTILPLGPAALRGEEPSRFFR